MYEQIARSIDRNADIRERADEDEELGLLGLAIATLPSSAVRKADVPSAQSGLMIVPPPA